MDEQHTTQMAITIAMSMVVVGVITAIPFVIWAISYVK